MPPPVMDVVVGGRTGPVGVGTDALDTSERLLVDGAPRVAMTKPSEAMDDADGRGAVNAGRAGTNVKKSGRHGEEGADAVPTAGRRVPSGPRVLGDAAADADVEADAGGEPRLRLRASLPRCAVVVVARRRSVASPKSNRCSCAWTKGCCWVKDAAGSRVCATVWRGCGAVDSAGRVGSSSTSRERTRPK